GLSSGDGVHPWKDIQTSEETQETRIYCNYSLTDSNNIEYLFWYQQTSGRKPIYILHNMKSGQGAIELRSKDCDTRFKGHLNISMKNTFLSITNTQLSDSALYYCALRPTVMLIKVHLLTKTLLKACVCFGNQISSKTGSLLKTEDETITVDCTFSTSYTDYYIFWYRQYPGKALQFIVRSGYSSHTADFAKQRFSSTADKSRELTTLTISNVQLEDSAMYYCALTWAKADGVYQAVTELTYEGKNTVLRCNHSITNFQSMFWYLQRPIKAPEYLIHGYDSAQPNGRFSMIFDRDNRVTHLSITNTEIEDAATYYCAVQPTVVHIEVILLQKHIDMSEKKTQLKL
ncbi:VPRE2 protein, partial [Amia calva]|nr:VPRE2 protein [Amia calva]